jgi:membrane associated rhomboid family serine protease
MTPTPPVPPAEQSAQPAAVPVCYRHPKRETYVRCVRCERYICPDCMHEASVGHQCPECVAEGRRTVRQARTPFGSSLAGTQGTVTKTLIVINSLMMLVTLAFTGRGLLFGEISQVHVWGGLIAVPAQLTNAEGAVVATVGGISGGEYYRLFTSMFLHFGLIHLLVNMYALWVLGRTLEGVLGRGRFLALYLLSGFGGSVAVYLFEAPDAITAGASGAIFGLFSGLFVVMRRLGRDTSWVVPVLVINVIISFVWPVSILGHLGGLITGAVAAAVIAFAPRRNRTAVQVIGLGLLALVLLLLVVAGTIALRATG